MRARSFLLAAAFNIFISQPVNAQELSTEELRARIKAQIEAQDAKRKGAPDAGNQRKLMLNNHQDANEEFYERPAAQAAAPTYQAPPPPDPSIEVSFEIQFEFASAAIKPLSMREIFKASEVLSDPSFANVVFVIIGHTDATGSAAYNRNLSQRRAASVVEELADLGVRRTQLMPIGVGFDQLKPGIAPADARNRRVEIRALRED